MLTEILTIQLDWLKKASRTGPVYFACAVFLLTLCDEEYEKTPSDSEKLALWYKDFKRFILAPVDKFFNSLSDCNVPDPKEMRSLQESIDNYTKRWNPSKSTDREMKVKEMIKPDKAKKLDQFMRKLQKLTEGTLDVHLVYYRPNPLTPRVLDVVHIPHKVNKNVRLDSVLFFSRKIFDALPGINVYSESAVGYLNELEYTTLPTIKLLSTTHQITVDDCRFHLLGDRRFLMELYATGSQKCPKIIRNIYESKNGSGTFIAKNENGSLEVLPPDISQPLSKGSNHTWLIMNISKGKFVDDIFNIWDVDTGSMGIGSDGLAKVMPVQKHGIDVPPPENGVYLSPVHCSSSTTVVGAPIPTPPFPQPDDPITVPVNTTLHHLEQAKLFNSISNTKISDVAPYHRNDDNPQGRPSKETFVVVFPEVSGPTKDRFFKSNSPMPIPQFPKSSSSPAQTIMYLSSHSVTPAKDSSSMVTTQPNLTTHDVGVQDPLPSTTPTISFPLPISKPEPGPSTLKRPAPQPKELTTKHDSSGKSPVPNLATTPTPIPQSGSNPAPAQRDRVQQISDSVNVSTTSRNTATQPSKPTSGKPVQEARISAKPTPPITPPAPQSKPEKVKKSWFRRIVDVFTGES